MKIQISHLTILLAIICFSFTSCIKENFDNQYIEYEDPNIISVEIAGDAGLGFALSRPVGMGGFGVFGGSTNNGNITKSIEDGLTTYTINSFVEDGSIWTQKVVFQSESTDAGSYAVTEFVFTTQDETFAWEASEISGEIEISDFSGTPNHVDGSITLSLVNPDSGDDYLYNSNFVFIPFL